MSIILNIGDTFGKLTVISNITISENNRRKYLCECSCGNHGYYFASDLKSGHTKSCGCLTRKADGGYGTRLYRVWNKMKDRCYNQNHIHYTDYGGRGITVCDEWKNDFASFKKWALNNGYVDNLSIDRIDNNKGYSPDNCRWADAMTQLNNTRYNHKMSYKGKTQNMSQWAREFDIPITTLHSRLTAGWSDEEALSRPIDKSKSTKRRKIA